MNTTLSLIILIPLLLCEMFLLSLQCRRMHPDLQKLRQWRYAHRGFHDKPTVPENSMAAFRRAVENGYGAELDVHLMADGNLAVIHDSSLARTVGADVEIEDLTKEQLSQYCLEGTREHIPMLEEVLELFEDESPLIIELKSARGNHKRLTAAVMEMLEDYRVTYCIESFDPRCLQWLDRHYPDVVRGQLSENFLRHGDGAPQSKIVLFALSKLLMNFTTHPDFIAYRFEDRTCFPLQLCRKIYRVQEVNWTIRSREDMLAAEDLGNMVIFEQFDPKGE